MWVYYAYSGNNWELVGVFVPLIDIRLQDINNINTIMYKGLVRVCDVHPAAAD